ncbi:MAG: MFS transporter [Anaerolineales bacterium]|nr:MFS transporter [Anaerolineales bacterium]
MTRDLRFLSLSLLLWGIGEGLFIYFQPLYLEELGADPLQIGGILGLGAVFLVLFHLPAGALADLIGRKTIMVSAWFSGLIGTLTMFFANSLPIFVLGLVIYSFSGFVLSPLSSYITAAKGKWSVARALTTVTAFFSFGTVLSPIIGGQIAERFGLRTIYGVAAFLFFISMIFVLFVRSQPVERAKEGPRYGNLVRNYTLIGFLLLVFVASIGMYLSWPLTPIYLREERLVSISTIGIFGSINALGIVVLNLTLGRMIPRSGFLLAQSLVGASTLFIWKGIGAGWYAFGYFLAAGYRTSRYMVSAQVETLVAKTEMGLAYGLTETINGTVILIASPIAGSLYSLEPDLPFMVSLALTVIAVVLVWRFWPHVRRNQLKIETKGNY